MIYVNFPVGCFHGWGVCGKYITREMAKLTDIRLISNNLDRELRDDPVSLYSLKPLLAKADLVNNIYNGRETVIKAPVLHAIGGDFKPYKANLKGFKNIGYTFFETDNIPEKHIENAKKYYDLIITGSSWCEEVLLSYGLENVKTIIQGIDPQIFNPASNTKQILQDKFVIFSGGKFEFRKSQDIVIKAVKTLQEKYKNIVLITSWNNMWESSFSTMGLSKHINYPFSTEQKPNLAEKQAEILLHIMTLNGINPDSVITLPALPNSTMASIYKNTDIGFFPNRCEGGTNLVLMEYMACGKPVIASYNSGHKDILTEKNSFMIKNNSLIEVAYDGVTQNRLYEPDFEETLSLLEQAYQDWAGNNSKILKQKAVSAGEDLSKLNWEKTAKEFLEVIQDKKQITEDSNKMATQISLNQIDFLTKKFAKTFVDYLEDHEKFAKNFSLLMKDLSKENQDLLKNIYSRMNFVHHSPVYSIMNYTQEEKNEQQQIRQNYSSAIKKSGEYFQYKDYILPVNHFEPSVFYYELGIDYIENPEYIAGKDILDIGAFIGDSALVLSKLNPAKIHAFEPVTNLYNQMNLAVKINNLENMVSPVKLGLGEAESEFEIGIQGSGSSTETWKNNSNVQKEIIKVSTVDKFVSENNLNVGLIKIDTESCELEILKGAVETIKAHKPTMLVSIYHTAIDFFEAKPFIESLSSDYKFKVAKFNPYSMIFETVLIAEPKHV